VVQLESNASRTGMTPWGPGSIYTDAANVFVDHIQINLLGQPGNDSSQTFWASAATRLPTGKFGPSGPLVPVLVRDLDGNEFCNLKVWEDNSGARINGNLITEGLRSFLPPR